MEERKQGFGRRLFRKFFTMACNFMYRHPFLFRFANWFLFGNRDKEWRQLTARKIADCRGTLEIGCGMYPAIENGIAIDFSLPLLKELKKKSVSTRTEICASAMELPFRNETFDSAISIFPPGIAADNGFFQERSFWKELARVLVKNGRYVSAIYVDYGSKISRISAKIIDPLHLTFWKRLKDLTPEFNLEPKQEPDSAGNLLLFLIATKI